MCEQLLVPHLPTAARDPNIESKEYRETKGASYDPSD
jgi:hypothetical protein